MVAKILTKLAKEALRKVGKNRKKLTAKEKAEGPLGDTKLKPKKKLSKKKQAERRAQNLAAAEKRGAGTVKKVGTGLAATGVIGGGIAGVSSAKKDRDADAAAAAASDRPVKSKEEREAAFEKIKQARSEKAEARATKRKADEKRRSDFEKIKQARSEKAEARAAKRKADEKRRSDFEKIKQTRSEKAEARAAKREAAAAPKKRATVTGREDDMASRNITLFGGKKKANVTREQMTNLGLDPQKKSDLTRYLNAYDGLGRRPKTKSDLEGYAKGGAVKKKQGSDARLDESLGERKGAERTKSQSFKSRRKESRGARKPSKPESAGAATRGWGAAIK